MATTPATQVRAADSILNHTVSPEAVTRGTPASDRVEIDLLNRDGGPGWAGRAAGGNDHGEGLRIGASA